MKNPKIILALFITFVLITSCKKQSEIQDEKTPLVSVKTTFVKQGNIESIINLNGKTIYLKKNPIASPISGYIVKVNVKYGDLVQKNSILFEIQTKENKALENINKSSGNSGIIKILASSSGIIEELNISDTGGYVVEGSLLCSIVENKNLVVQVNVPFEHISQFKIGSKCKILLPDNTKFDGSVSQILPIVSPADQTQNVLIKPNINRQLPENLNLIIQFVNVRHIASTLVLKEAVIADEVQSKFWVMKLINQKLAVKIPIIKGIENDSIIEILSSELNPNDIIISEGAYGLPDSTIVKVVK
jgi:hypothetical protein